MAAKKKDPLDALAEGSPLEVIALMLWKNRHREPDMYVQITETDIKGFRDSVEYQKLKPSVSILRDQGQPASPAIPAVGKRRAIPARPATPPKPFVMVTLVEEGTGNVIRPIENNDQDYDHAQEVAQIRRAREQAPQLADLLMRMARSGDYSESDLADAANTLRILSRAA